MAERAAVLAPGGGVVEVAALLDAALLDGVGPIGDGLEGEGEGRDWCFGCFRGDFCEAGRIGRVAGEFDGEFGSELGGGGGGDFDCHLGFWGWR